MLIGLLLIIFGVLMLLDRMGIIYGDIWDYFWPLAVIAFGLSIIFKEKRKHNR
jgi:membrane-bound ClpP family serine protease